MNQSQNNSMAPFPVLLPPTPAALSDHEPQEPQVLATSYSQMVHPTLPSFIKAKTSSSSTPSTKEQHTAVPRSLYMTERLIGDIAIGTGVTFFVAPFVSILDKAIVESASGQKTLFKSGMDSIRGMARNPVSFLRSPTFLWMWAVYAATYSTANCLKTLVMDHDDDEHDVAAPSSKTQSLEATSAAQHTVSATSTMAMFVGTTFSNAGFAVLKDRAYAQMFGTTAPKAVPLASYAIWLTRDFTVVGSSFLLPDMVAARYEDPDEKARAQSMAQLLLPAACQLIAGPLHLWGLDVYNRPLADMTMRRALWERMVFLRQGYVTVCSARIARIAPAYGIGGVLNTRFRDQWKEYLRQPATSESWIDQLQGMGRSLFGAAALAKTEFLYLYANSDNQNEE